MFLSSKADAALGQAPAPGFGDRTDARRPEAGEAGKQEGKDFLGSVRVWGDWRLQVEGGLSWPVGSSHPVDENGQTALSTAGPAGPHLHHRTGQYSGPGWRRLLQVLLVPPAQAPSPLGHRQHPGGGEPEAKREAEQQAAWVRGHVQLGHEPVAEADLVEGADAAVRRVEQYAAVQEHGPGHEVEAQQHGQGQQRLPLAQEARPGLRRDPRGPRTLRTRRAPHWRRVQPAHRQLQQDLRRLPPGQRHAPVPEPVVRHEQLRGGDRRGRGVTRRSGAARACSWEIRGARRPGPGGRQIAQGRGPGVGRLGAERDLGKTSLLLLSSLPPSFSPLLEIPAQEHLMSSYCAPQVVDEQNIQKPLSLGSLDSTSMEPSPAPFSGDTCAVLVIAIPLAMTITSIDGALWMCQALSYPLYM